MLLIYSQQLTSRLNYALQFYFGELIQTEYQVTINAAEFQSYEGPKLNYGKTRIGNEVFVYAHDLLFETEIHEQEISVAEYRTIKTIFAHAEQSDFPFDPFAAAFYLLSRYEEYLPFRGDKHGRFPDQMNLAFRKGFHEVPVVNHYAIFLKELLQQRYPQLKFKTSLYKFQLTYDIDSAFSYQSKGMVRNAAGILRSVLKSDLADISSRSKVLLGREPDPFDTFDFQFWLHEKYSLSPIYFFLLGDYGSFDKNISWRKKTLQQLLRKISEQNDVGIHSSYASNTHPEKISAEKFRLEKITGKKVFRNRQHYLKLQFPQTYRNLIAHGITEDSTMGFASLCGFRAAVASSFLWYDLQEEKTTSLRIFPFAVMDASLFYYLKLSAEEALQTCKQLVDQVRKVNGTFQFLAHNDLLSEQEWKGWRTKFEELIAYASTL